MRVDIYSDFVLKDILQSYSSIRFSECIRDAGDIQLSFTDSEVYRNPAGTMDLPLGQPSGGAVFPCKDIFLSPKLAEDRFLAMNRAHTLLAIVTAVSVQLCSLLDSSGRLQESSRKHALLQAAYLPRGKTVIAHHFLTLSVLAILPLPEVLST